MNLSTFSCSHFLSIKKPNTVSKRARDRRTGQEVVVAKSRLVSLISRSVSAYQSPMLDSGVSFSFGNYRFGWHSDLTSAERSVRDRVENSASSSQVWHRDDNLFPSTERSGRQMTQRSSTWRLVREVQNQFTKVTLNHHNLEIPDTRYIEKVFANVRQKLNRPESDRIVLDQKVNVLIWRLFMSTAMT